MLRRRHDDARAIDSSSANERRRSAWSTTSRPAGPCRTHCSGSGWRASRPRSWARLTRDDTFHVRISPLNKTTTIRNDGRRPRVPRDRTQHERAPRRRARDRTAEARGARRRGRVGRPRHARRALGAAAARREPAALLPPTALCPHETTTVTLRRVAPAPRGAPFRRLLCQRMTTTASLCVASCRRSRRRRACHMYLMLCFFSPGVCR